MNLNVLAQIANTTQTPVPNQQVPPGVVWVYSSFLDTLILIAVLLGIGLIAVVCVWGITKFRTPRESNKTTEASHAKRNLLLLAHDDGTCSFETSWKVGHEGSVETKPVGKQKKHWTGFLPRQSRIQPVQVTPAFKEDGSIDEDKTVEIQQRTQRAAEYVNKLNTRSLLLPGARVKIWLAVKPKAILASLEAIAAVQILEEIKVGMGDAFPIDVPALKTMVASASWNESQINAQEEDKFHAGEISRAQQGEDFKKMCLYLAIPILAVAVLVLAKVL